MPDPNTPAPDPGLFVTTAEIQTYAFMVDGMIRLIAKRVDAREQEVIASLATARPLMVLPLDVHARWVTWRLDWEGRFQGYRSPGWFSSGSDYDAIRATHLEALQWRDRWAALGVSFEGLSFPQPGNYHVEAPSLPGGFGAGLAVGAVALGAAYLLLMRRR